MELILASGSPRRKELLALITPEFTVHTSDVDESVISAPAPELLVQKLAQAKCRAVAAQHPAACVLGCDTVVDVDGEEQLSTLDSEEELEAVYQQFMEELFEDEDE